MSMQFYDPKMKAFRAFPITPDTDLPFEQVLLFNILLELKVMNELRQIEEEPNTEDLDDIRAAIVNEI